MIKRVLQIGALVLALGGCVQHKEFRREVNLNRDSFPDIVELKDKAVYVKLSSPFTLEGRPVYFERQRVSQEYYKVADMEVKDSDGDGNLDIIYYIKDSTQPFSRIMYGKGDGTFSVDLANHH
jgi:hypothetical protein